MGEHHWSKPGAIRTLKALRAHGWRATTWQIAQITGSLAAHTDVASLRCLFRELGALDWRNSVTSRYQRTTDAGHRVYLYVLRRDLLTMARDVLEERPVQAALF